MQSRFLLVLICGIFFYNFSQAQVSEKNLSNDKWEIKPALGAIDKAKLNVNYPSDQLWTILIASPGDRQTLKYVTSGNLPVDLTPSNYYVEFTNVPIGNVPFKAGMETRIKTGIISIVRPGTWTIYDQLKKTYYKTGTTPQKIILPVGNYQVKIGSKFYSLVIKDGETSELVQIDTEIKIVQVKKQNDPNSSIIDAEQYIMSPIADSGNNEKRTTGLLWLIPSQLAFGHQLNYKFALFKAGQSTDPVFQCDYSLSGSAHCWPSIPLPGGTYDIHLGGNYHVSGINCSSNCIPLVLKNIPIRNGYETKLKYGWLDTRPNAGGLLQVLDASKQNAYHRYLSVGRLPYPVGKYVVKHFFVDEFPIVIAEGKTTMINSIDSNHLMKPKWINHPGKNLKPGMGRLRTNFQYPESFDSAIKSIVRLQVPSTNGSGYNTLILDTVKYTDLKPGPYKLLFNGVSMNIIIEPGKETVLKYGVLIMTGARGKNPKIGAAYGSDYMTENGTIVMALPNGYYRMIVETRTFLVKITESTTSVIEYDRLFVN